MTEDCRTHQVILFDIDGTLIFTGGAGGRAMSRAFRTVYHVDDGLAAVPMAGRTDAVILRDAMARHGVEPTEGLLGEFRATYFHCLSEELAHVPPTARIMPGVVALLGALAARRATTTALLTGNFSDTARLKLERFGLWHWFAFGAFGEDAPERAALVPVAIDRARRLSCAPVQPSDVVVIGDTPLDVACGRVNGARTIGVATGDTAVAALTSAGADAALADLSDAAGVLTLLDGFARRGGGQAGTGHDGRSA
jgi:phosphoglycolate phosphatase-like HAD superfamily hydrolase